MKRQEEKFTQIKGVLFDVDGTLYHQSPLRVIMLLLFVVLNVHSPRMLFRKLRVIAGYRKSQEVLRGTLLEPGDNPCMSQLALTVAKTGESLNFVSDVVEEWFERRSLQVIRLCRRRDLTKSFERLREKGIIIGVFSDYPVTRKLETLGVSRFVTAVVSASDPEVHGFKPKTNGYAIAASRMGLSPSEILHVGDRPEVDGNGGLEAGMKVVIIKSLLRKRANRNHPLCDSLLNLVQRIE